MGGQGSPLRTGAIQARMLSTIQWTLSEMKDQQKAGLGVNWIGHQCTMTLHSMGITLDKPKAVFDSLKHIQA